MSAWDAADVCLFAVDSSGRVTSSAGAGVSPLEGLGSPPDVLAHPVLGEQARRALRGEAFHSEATVGGVPFDLRWRPLDGGAVAVATVRHAQSQGDEAFLKVFHASPVPISISTLEGGVFSHCNDAFVETFGYPREEVVGHGSVELGMWTAEERAAAIAELRAKGVLRHWESPVRTKAGVSLDTIFNMERIELGGRACLVGIFYDITARKRAEAEQRRLYERLRELDELKGQLFANVSHELRTPLTLILGLTARMLRDDALRSAHDDLEAVHRNARALLQQVNDLLDVARLDAGRIGLLYASVDVAALVRTAASPFEVLASERGIRLVLDAAGPLAAEVDAEKVERIVLNLLSNALKFTPSGGVVTVRTATAGDRLLIDVSDTGPGVPDEHRESVFERFFQAEGGATRRFGGTGLGLAIVREFAVLHGGTAHVERAEAGGARFVVTLPLAAPPGTILHEHVPREVPDRHVPTATPAVDEAAVVGPEGRPLVLVVEDNADMRAFLVAGLVGTWRVATAADGEMGLARARELGPDLVLSDVMMPRHSGDQLVTALRSEPRFDDTPIVLVTAKADDELRVRLLRAGANDYVTKPFAMEELHARVANLLAAKGATDVLKKALGSTTRDLDALARALAARTEDLERAQAALERRVQESEALQAVGAAWLRTHDVAATEDAAAEATRRVTGAVVPLGDGPPEPGATPFLDTLSSMVRSARAQARTEEKLREAQTLEVVGRLAGGVAHDLNNLLTVIGAVPSLVRSAAVLERGAERALADLEASAERAALLTEQLLGFTRRREVPLEPTRLGAAVRQWRGLLSRLLGETIPVEIQVDDEDLAIRAAPVYLARILLNLAVNARDAQPAGGRLRIRVAGEPGGVRLEVADDGVGMPPEVRARVFEPFYTTKEHGTGLGLATVADLVARLDGTVRVDSEPGKGTTFTLRFPAADAPPPIPASRPAQVAPRDRFAVVVDDDPLVREVVGRFLSHEGYRVELFADGPTLLARLGATPQPDVLVCDVKMPAMTGPDLLGRLLQAGFVPPVLLVSGHTHHHDGDGIGWPAPLGFLAKPFGRDDLLRATRALLEPAKR